jgi:hypothetical protein
MCQKEPGEAREAESQAAEVRAGPPFHPRLEIHPGLATQTLPEPIDRVAIGCVAVCGGHAFCDLQDSLPPETGLQRRCFGALRAV